MAKIDIENLNKEAQKIHKSTKTSIPFFIFLHNKLRAISKLYYKWHLNSKASAIHWFAFSWYTLTIFFVVLLNFFIPTFPAFASSGNWSQTTFTGSDGTYTDTKPANSNADASLDNYSALSNPGAGGKWQYKKPVTITNSGSAQTDYQVLLDSEANVVGDWHLDENTGTTANDSSRNGNNGTLTNGPTWATGKYGQALSFDGTDDWVNLGSGLDPSFEANPAALSIEFWFKPDSTATETFPLLFSNHKTTTPASGFYLAYDKTNKQMASQFALNDDWANSTNVGSGSNTITEDTWNHVVYTVGGTNVSVYVNGTHKSTLTGTRANLGDVIKVLNMGRNVDVANYFKGLIDEVKIYNRALSTSEVQARYNDGGFFQKVKSDGSDVRITDSDKTTERPYWVESFNNSSTTKNYKIWVKIPSVPNGTKDIYMYYGNASATSASSGSNTFNAYADFESGMDGFDAGTRTTAQAYEGSYSLQPPSGYTTKTYSSSYPSHYEAYVYMTTGFEIQVNLTDNKVAYVAANGPTSGYWGYFTTSWQTSSVPTTSSVWQKLTIDFDASGNYTAKIDGNTIASNIAGSYSGSWDNRLRFYGSGGYADRVIFRKSASIEPTSFAGSEGSAYVSSGTLVSNAINGPAGFYDWGNLTFTKSTPLGTALTVDVLRASDNALLVSNVATGTDLSTVISNSETSIKLRANFSGDGSNTSTLSDWSVDYSYDTEVPTVPQNLTLTPASNSQINLSWDASTDTGGSGLAGYKIERAPDVGGSPGSFTQIDTSGTNSYSSGSLSSNTKYWYRVRAYDNADNNSNYSTSNSWFNFDWNYKKDITFNTTATGANVASSQINFPAAVHINSSSWPNATERSHFFGAWNAGGKRVRFYDSDGTTNLSYEVEYYDQASQEALYWVKVPQVDGNSSTDKIIVAYGNDAYGSDQDNKTAVWDSNFKGILHLGDNAWSGSTAYDSTANPQDGSNQGSTDVGAVARQGRSFNGADNAIGLTNNSKWNFTSGITIEMWVYLNAYPPAGEDRGFAGKANAYYYNYDSSSQRVYQFGSNPEGYHTSNSAVPLSAWTYVAYTFNGSNVTFYKNGVQDGSPSSTGTISTSTSQLAIANIGQPTGFQSRWLNGRVDEVRFSATGRSSDWMKLSYYTMKKTNWNGDSWITLGSEEYPQYHSATSLCNTPTGINANADSTSQITVSWNANSDSPAHYHVYDGIALVGDDIAGTSYPHSGLSPNTQHTYTVKAVNSAGAESAASSPLSKYTLPNTPTSPSAVAASVSQIDVSWLAGVGGADHYHVRSSSDNYASIKYDGALTNWSETLLSTNTQYTYRIWAVNADGAESATYATVSKYTLSSNPTGAAATDGTYIDKINVSWNSGGAQNHYHVWRDGVSGAGTLVYDNTLTSFDDIITGSHTYYVYSVNGDGVESASYSSDTGYTLTAPNAPTAGSPSALSTTSIRWNFTDNASNETGFRIYDGATLRVQVATPDLSYIDESSLSANTQYTRQVKAYNGAGESSASADMTRYTLIETPTGISFDTINTGSITISATGSLSNLSSGSSGLYFENVTAGTNSGWIQTNFWTSSTLNPNTQYSFKVKARNGNSIETSFTAESQKYTLANTPGTPTTSAVSQTSLNVIIDQNSNPAGTQYAIQEQGSGNYVQADGTLGVSVVWQDYTTWGGASGKNVTGLSANTQYTFKVKAWNGDLTETSFGGTSSKYTLANIPGTPTVSAIPATQINVIIDQNSNPANTTYAIQETGSSNYVNKTTGALQGGVDWGTYAEFGSGSGKNVTGLSANTQYTFKVKARNGDSTETSFGGTASKYTLSDDPTNVAASDGTYPDKIAVSWVSGGAQNHYHVWRDGISGVGTLVYDNTGTSFDDIITGNHNYFAYSVNGDAIESSGYSSDSGSTMVGPNAPTAGTPTALSSTSIRWNFTDNASNEEGFKTHDGAHNVMVQQATPDLTYLDETSLIPAFSYTRHIHAYNAFGDSTPSGNMTIYTLANTPGTPTLSSVSESSINVIIDQNSNSASAQYAIQETGSGNYVNKTTGALQGGEDWGTYAEFGSGSGKNVTGLSANTQYTFKVKAKNGDSVETSFSGTASKYTLIEQPTGANWNTITQTSINLSATGTLSNLTTALSGIYFRESVTSTNTGWIQSNVWNKPSLSVNTQYHFYVTVRNADSTANTELGPYDKYTLANTPGTPTTSAVSVSSLNAIISQNSNPANTTYTIYEETTGNYVNKTTGALQAGADWGTYAEFGSGSGINVTGLSANTNYTFRVKARNGESVETSFGDSSSRYTLIQQPTGVTWDNVGTGAILLSATGTLSNLTSGSSGIYFENTTVPANSGWLQTTSWNSTSLTSNKQYTFQATARNADGVSNTPVSLGSKYTKSLSPNVSSDRSISTWYNSGNFTFTSLNTFGEGGVAYYRYVWDQNATHSFNDTETQWNSGTKTMTPSSDGSWYFHTKSYNGEDVSGGTQTYGPYFYDATPPSNPSNLVATPVSTSQINLSWIISTDATSGFYRYIIYSSTNGITFNQIGYATSNSYSDYGLTPATTYYYKVKAQDNALNASDFSNSASATTQSPPVPPEQPPAEQQPSSQQQQQSTSQPQTTTTESAVIVDKPVTPSSVDAKLGDSNLSVPLIVTDNQTKVLSELVQSVHIKLELPGTTSATAIIGNQQVELHNTGGNVFEADIPVPKEPGSYTIKVKSVKTDGTIVEQQTLTVLIDPYGYVYDRSSKARIANAEVTLFEKDNEGQWKKWDASKYSQTNPQNTNRSGDYGFMTPKGTYYIQATAPGYKDYKSEELIVRTDPITLNIPLEPSKVPFWNTERIIIGVLSLFILSILGAGAGFYIYKKRY